MFTIGNYKNKVEITSSPAVEKYTRESFYKTPIPSAARKKNSVVATTPGYFFHDRNRNLSAVS